MDSITVLLMALIVICTGIAGVLAWMLHRQGEPILPWRLAPRVRRSPPILRTSSSSSPHSDASPSTPQHRPPLAPLDRGDPTVRRYEKVLAELGLAQTVARGVPEALQDRVTMRTELMAIEQHLGAIRDRLATADLEARAAEGPRLRRLSGRLVSIRRDAETIATNLEQLADQERRLTAETLVLGDDLAALERRSPYPPAAASVASSGAELLARVRRLPPIGAIGSFNALKYRLREAEELRAEVGRCRTRLAGLLDPQAALLALLTSPIADVRSPAIETADQGDHDWPPRPQGR